MESLTNSTQVVCWLRVEWCRTIGADEAPMFVQKGLSRIVLTVMVVGVERPVRAVSMSKDRDMDRKKVLLRKKSPSLSLLMKEGALLKKLRPFCSRRAQGLLWLRISYSSCVA